jgi:putative transposase
MQFDTGHLYHIFNQGNNRQKVFLNRENYHFFLRKIQKHVLPFADVLAWCLMPNHFHLMVYVNHVEIESTPSPTPSPTLSRTRSQMEVIPSPTPNRTRNTESMSFNKSIGIMLASYTRAINKQQDWSGSLFRSETKAICLTDINGISPNWITKMGITEFIVENQEIEYPNVCFNYILYNPVKDRLVKRPEDWEFSSFLDLINIRKGNLINRDRIQEFGLNISGSI